jgi:hypothetical protein
MGSMEFLQLTEASMRSATSRSGASEFGEILRILEGRAAPSIPSGSIGPAWTLADQTLWRRGSATVPSAEVTSLSPAAGSVTLAVRAFGALLPTIGPVRKIVAPPTPNQAAVVISVKFGIVTALFGADLEASANPMIGWQAAIQSIAGQACRAHIFKIPHHGSANADEPQIWTTLLAPDPYSALTPFTRGTTPLPRATDIARLRRRTANLYATARPTRLPAVRRSPAVERTLKEMSVRPRALSGAMGHVRIRANSATPSAIHVDVFNGAFRI